MSSSLADRKSSAPKAAVVAVALGALVALLGMAQPAQAQTVTLLWSFGGKTDGGNPSAPLIRNSQGDLLGTTTTGGKKGFGTFFKVSNREGTVLHTFLRTDGQAPMGKIVRDAAGNFYGTTEMGGASLGGTIYKMDKTGALTTLFSFHQYVGTHPAGGVVMDSAGNLYGTNGAGGGTNGTGTSWDGDVFELSNTGVYTVLHRFIEGTTDGAAPDSDLLRDSLGNLYGTTAIGGNYHCTSGCGTVFKISATGVEKVLHRFAGVPNDGAYPEAGLIRDHAGNFYGTTTIGGTANLGTVFKIDTSGNETVLYSFQGGESDGAQPTGNLVMDSDGTLYGTTTAGGNTTCAASGCGVVFRLDSSGVESLVYVFGGIDGATPRAGLTLGSDGNLYGTTFYGGAVNAGTVFEIIF